MKTLLHTLPRSLVAALFSGAIVSAAAEAPAASPAVDQPKAGSYHIQVTDKLSISVSNEPTLNVVGKRVDRNGNINVQLLANEIHVGGLTVKEAQAAIENAYRDGRILRKPQVFVTIEEYAPREITVSGLVKAAGKVQILPESVMTLKDAILKCGGLADTANGKAVRVSRPMPDGTTKVFEKLDVESALQVKKSAKIDDANFALEPGDTVYVPEHVI